MSDPVRLLKLRARGFRNLHLLDFEPGPRFNVIHGDNGQGKSNLLEAVDYLATLQSFRGARGEELIAEGGPGAELLARVSAGPLPNEHRVLLPRGGARKVTLGGKRPSSRAAYVRAMQLVLFHPGDMTLTTGAPEARRAFLDRLLEQFDPTFTSTLSAYTRALRSRNRLLKGERPDRRAIGAYDELLASAGAVIGQARARLATEITPRVQTAFDDISGQGLGLSLVYEPRVVPEVDALRQALQAALPKDLARGFTADGPHADDLVFKLDDSRAKRFASQGQHRAIVLALKVAELHELEKRTGRVPILLLDDVSSELDRTRNRQLFELLSKLGGQVFLTTTHPEFILIDTDRVDFQVREGTLSETSVGG